MRRESYCTTRRGIMEPGRPDLWPAQLDAARRIRAQYGVQKALGYLVGEKLVGWVRSTDRDPLLAGRLEAMARDVKRAFSEADLRGYFAGVTRVGVEGHVATVDQIERLREAGVIEGDVLTEAEKLVTFERVREMVIRRG